MFVTVFISITDLDTGEWQYAQAGHPPIAYCPAGGDFCFIETESTMPLWFFPKKEYTYYSRVISPGDKFFYYTDGVTEALDRNDVEWGNSALLAVLNDNSGLSCADIVKSVRKGIERHKGDAKQSDDITMLIIEYLALGNTCDVREDHQTDGY
jgi:sigma-B regulation protein RsbU (phosphoserine phosphatase)